MPKKYERRMSWRKGQGKGFWLVEVWRECTCPDCDEKAHWMFEALTDRESAERMTELRSADA